MNSAVAARRNAMIAAINADVPLSTLLQGEKIYQRRAPENSPLPYILTANTVETEAAYMMQPGQQGIEDMTIWGEDIHQAVEVYLALYPVLNKRKIAMSGHLQVYGTLSYLTDFPDPSREAHGITARWRVRTINA